MKASIDALYSLVLAQNPGLTLAKDHISFGTPTRVTAEEFAARGRNTKMTLAPAAGAFSHGTVDVFYDRLILNDLLVGVYGPGEISVPVGTTYTTLADTLPNINAMHGTTLVPSDVNATDAADVDNGNWMTVVPGNIAYDGQVYIDFPSVAVDMASVVTVTQIGAIYPGKDGIIQRFSNANGGTPFTDGLTLSAQTVLDAATAAANGNSDCSAVIGYSDITNLYTGTVTVYYNRISFTTAFGSLGAKGPTYLLPAGATTSADLLTVLNARTGLNLTANDIVVEALPALVSGTANYTVTAAATSFLYTGGFDITLVDALPDVNTLMSTYVPDLPDSGVLIVESRIWAVNIFTSNDYNWLRLTSAVGYDPDLPYYTVEPAVTNDQTTKDAHGGREASVTLTFHDISGCTGTLVFYFNRYNLSAVNGGSVWETTGHISNRLLSRDQFSGAVSDAGGPSLGSTIVQPEIVDYHGYFFVSENGTATVTYAAVPGSAVFVGQVQIHITDGDPPTHQV